MFASRVDWVRCKGFGCRRKTRNQTRLCSERCAERVREERVGEVVLLDGARPVETDPYFFDDVDDHRRVWCRRQANCLDFAERSGWKAMSCSMCGVRDELTEEEKKLSWLRTLDTIDEAQEALRPLSRQSL